MLEDYKEAEGFPDMIAAEFDAAAERVAFAAEAAEEPSAVDARALRGRLVAALESVFVFLQGDGDDRDVMGAVGGHYRAVAIALSRSGASDAAEAVLGHAFEVRKTLGRLYVIKRTDFLQSGAALMELLVNITILLTVLGRDTGDGLLSAYANVAFNCFQFRYVIELLRDIDDPFDYGEDALLPIVEVDDEGGRTVGMRGAGNSAEVDPFPLMNAYGRLMVDADAPAVADDCVGADFIGKLRTRMAAVWGEGGAGGGELNGADDSEDAEESGKGALASVSDGDEDEPFVRTAGAALRVVPVVSAGAVTPTPLSSRSSLAPTWDVVSVQASPARGLAPTWDAGAATRAVVDAARELSQRAEVRKRR